ncbi:MAG: cytochrome c3 family protein [Acidimicrobiia bacterium]
MHRMATVARPFLWIPAFLIFLSGCSDKETVFVERPFFDDPPAAATGFLGYGTEANTTAGVTVCGSCHSGKQSDWEGTAHAHAYETLAANPGAQPFCEDCHAVSANGNHATEPGGWTNTGDPRYQDVQCESCHGPGETHVANPGASQPLASIAVGADLTNGCGECHAGSHHPFLEEWSQSRHGFGGNEGVRGRAACASCHEGREALVALGVNSDYPEKAGAANQPIGCAVCHDPHGSDNPAQLRFPIDVPSTQQNLCMRCHQKRAVPELQSSRGPHSPQGPLVLGEDVGWIPPNFSTAIVVGSHGSELNQELCATCHVRSFTVTDPVTNDFVFQATGHLFKATPCIDGDGLPTTGSCTIQEQSFGSCTEAGCHASEDVARSLQTVADLRISTLVNQLDAQLSSVPASEFSTSDDVLTVAEGALFNQRLGAIPSSAIHNPFLTEALLLGSIQAVQNEYGIAPSIAPADIQERLEQLTKPSAR